MESGYHTPVLVAEVLRHLEPGRGGVYLDGTLGGGGHSEAILQASAQARVIGVDQDPEALDVATRRLARYGERVRVVRGNFADVVESVDEPLAGALLDLGISSRQIDASERGFSFRPGTPLDMRMAGSVSEENKLTAADLLHGQSEAELAILFRKYAEEPRARRLAAEIVRRRAERRFETSDDLNAAIDAALRRPEPSDRARIYQALRIAVNDELGVLERTLPEVRERLDDEGVFVVLSYHSLEDRLVKDAFREWSRSCVCPPGFPVCRCRGRALGKTLTKKPVMASAEEVAANPRARSARLRAWRKAA